MRAETHHGISRNADQIAGSSSADVQARNLHSAGQLNDETAEALSCMLIREMSYVWYRIRAAVK